MVLKEQRQNIFTSLTSFAMWGCVVWLLFQGIWVAVVHLVLWWWGGEGEVRLRFNVAVGYFDGVVVVGHWMVVWPKVSLPMLAENSACGGNISFILVLVWVVSGSEKWNSKVNWARVAVDSDHKVKTVIQ